MAIADWKGPETDIGCFCVAIAFTIESIEGAKDGQRQAKGLFTGKDYIEGGIVFSDPWEATGIAQAGGGFLWQVQRTNDGSAFWVEKDKGEAHFTLNTDVNTGIKGFIAGKLNEFLTEGRIIANVVKYEGPRDEYKDECVCERLHASNPQSEFPWEEMTNGGRFPQYCFACSCGTKWWNPEYALWLPVADDAAWQMLIEHNGIPIQLIGIMDNKIHLLQTLRDKGLIPLPTCHHL